MYSKEEAYAKISDLVERFSLQIDSYKKSDYNETLTRQDFINPFFKALGWDIDNSQGNAEAYREVIHEDKLKIGSATKAPDYSFRLPGGKRLFFVEAKKPGVLVKEDIVPAYQVRRYGWSAKLPISLITDFEEFAVYDCTKKPDPSDKASTARIKYFTYKQYLDEFDFIWDTFSKASVLKGSFDKFIVSDTYKKGTTTVDKEFLASLDEWRMLLAQNIALRNQNFTEDELNFVVQQTLDRIIFLRIAEDRGVEGYGELKETLIPGPSPSRSFGREGSFYQKLFNLFKEADSKYNSGLFDFKKDKLSANVIIDNKVIKTIISELYYPVSPYEFSVLGVEILGSAYEQFLGKQIKLSASHKAIIEEKPEVRKAGGVYYTPQYIVDYIVANTVGKLINDLEEKYTSKVSPPTGGGDLPAGQAGLVGAVAQLKIVDPACGSGSFLIGVYKYLLNWHLNFYKPEFIKLSETAADNNSNTKTREAAIKQRNKLPLTPEGNLTTALKKQILLNNIYGVDIDTQAVEVTRLSLLLKCMEGETGSSINAQMRFGERVLPTLDDNIKSGNSLIDVDFYDTEFDFGEEKKIKPFNWQQAFPKVFKQEGFDAVIGNPPYIPIEFFNEDEKKYYKKKFKEVNRKYDTSVLFTLRGLELLQHKGLLGFISTQTWQTGENYNEYRKKIFSDYGIVEIINLPFNVFEDAYVDTGIFIYSRKSQLSYKFFAFSKKTKLESIKEILFATINTSEIQAPNYKLIYNNFLNEILKRFNNNNYIELGKISISTQGLSGSRFEEVLTPKGKWVLPFIQATVKRYFFQEEKRHYVDLENLKSLYQFYTKEEKILIRRIINRQDRIDATFYSSEGVFKKDLNPFLLIDKTINTKYVLGLINSKFFSWLYINTSSIATKDDFRQTTLAELRKLPIKIIDEKNKSGKALHNEIVQLVETMLQLNKEKQQITLPDKLEQLNTRIKYTDDKINKLVYQLYGLSEEEIGIVEGK